MEAILLLTKWTAVDTVAFHAWVRDVTLNTSSILRN
jgi:hypothetical protein